MVCVCVVVVVVVVAVLWRVRGKKKVKILSAMKVYGEWMYNSTHSLPGHVMAALSPGKD
jgi:hypothetical protein